MTDIQITKAEAEPGAASFRVEIATERVTQARKKATRAVAQKVRLPGFRAGKAPLEVVERRYADAIRDQVIQDLIHESWRSTLEREQLEPIADPHIHDLKFEAGSPLTFELHVEVRPQLTLTQTGGFTLQREVRPVSDDLVQDQLDDLRKQRAPWSPITEHPAPGDMVRVTLATLTDGEAAEPHDYQIVIGQQQAIPDVEERLMRMAPGETADHTVRFPDDFPDEFKRGQSRQVRLTLHEAKRQDLPVLDDAFAGEVGDFPSLDALKTAVRQDLEVETRREADATLRRQVVERIAEANSVPAPRSLVERLLRAFAQTYEVPEESFPNFAQEFRPVAETQVRRDLILDHVAQTENLKASEDELDERVADLAARRNMEPGQLYASLQKAGRLKDLQFSITEEKVFAHLLGQSTIEER
jgi:trigger factor